MTRGGAAGVEPPPRSGSIWAWLLPTIALVGTCGLMGLVEPTETRYAAIARAMLDGGDWLIPRLNGIPHFHKPPVAYWLSAGGMAALGANEWGARLAVALAAGFTLWCTARIAARALESAGRNTLSDAPAGSPATVAPILLASCGLFFVAGRQLASDVFLAAAVAGFYASWLPEARRGGAWALRPSTRAARAVTERAMPV